MTPFYTMIMFALQAIGRSTHGSLAGKATCRAVTRLHARTDRDGPLSFFNSIAPSFCIGGALAEQGRRKTLEEAGLVIQLMAREVLQLLFTGMSYAGKVVLAALQLAARLFDELQVLADLACTEDSTPCH